MHKCWTLNSTIPFLLALFGHHPNLDDSHLKMHHSCAKLAHGATVENNKTQRVLFWTTCTRAVLNLPRWTQTFHIHICAGRCLFATQIISAMPYDPYDLAMGLWGTTSLTFLNRLLSLLVFWNYLMSLSCRHLSSSEACGAGELQSQPLRKSWGLG